MQKYAVTIRQKSPRKAARLKRAFSHGKKLSARFVLTTLAVGVAMPVAVASINVQRMQSANNNLKFSQTPIREDQPVLLTADHMEYDHQRSKVYAIGNVEISQSATILLADRLTYDQKTGKVVATGNVSVLEPTGNVYFADNVELVDTMRQGIVQHFRARLSDKSLFAAHEAEQEDQNRTHMYKAVYSPCSIKCTDGGTKTPLWQLRAADVVYDKAEHRVVYKDAFFELYGLPIAYTPYLSHAVPGAENKSGLMIPEYSHSENLGSVLKIPLYISLSPDKDMTLTPHFLGEESSLLEGEYRQAFDTGSMKLTGSITNPQDRDAGGFVTTGSALRWHIDSTGRFQPYDNTEWGFQIRRASDDTYLRRYDFSYETQLTSRVYLESHDFWNLGPRSEMIVEGLGFQGLTAQDITAERPYTLPLVDLFWQGEPGSYAARPMLHANLMNLYRSEGTKSRRLSLTGGYTAPYITPGGHIFNFSATLRGDIYSVDIPVSVNPQAEDFTGRFVPEVSATWRYPLIRRFANSSLLVEPTVDLILSPNGGNSDDIPNEDSLVPEFSDINLFSDNRFPGYDRIESGPRANFGVRSQYDWGGTRQVDFLFGQHYRTFSDRNFPLSNDITSHLSDYVGRIGVSSRPLTVSYRFRLDKDTFSPKRSEWNALYQRRPLTLAATYLKLDNDPILSSKEEITATMSLNLTKQWTFTALNRRDLQQNQLTTAGVGLIFSNECVTVSGIAQRDFTRDRDVKPDTSFYIRLGLKNLN